MIQGATLDGDRTWPTGPDRDREKQVGGSRKSPEEQATTVRTKQDYPLTHCPSGAVYREQ